MPARWTKDGSHGWTREERGGWVLRVKQDGDGWYEGTASRGDWRIDGEVYLDLAFCETLLEAKKMTSQAFAKIRKAFKESEEQELES